MRWMRLFALGAVFHGMMVTLAGAAALPFSEGSLLPNQQARPTSVTVDGNYAAVIMPGGIPRTFEKTGGNWLDILGDLPGSALSVSVKSGTTPTLAVGYSGRIELLSYDSSNAQWDNIATITLASGAQPKRLVLDSGRLAALVTAGGGDEATDVRIYEGSGSVWNETKVLTIAPPPGEILAVSSVVDSFDLSGTRIAVGSGGANEVRIHERNSGGTGNWGLVRTILPAAGFTRFGSALALENDKLVVNSIDGADGKPDIRAYQQNTGGANLWGYNGTVLDGATTFQVANFTFDMAGGRLVALGIPSLENLLQGLSGGQAWFFNTGASPSGWVQEAKYDLGRISFFGSSGYPLALQGDDCFIGLPDEEYLDSHGASWATCVHRRGAGSWARVQMLEGEGAPQALGRVLAMSGPYLIAGMPDDDGRGTNSGAAMLWMAISLPTNGDRWIPIGRLESPNPIPNERFGESVAIQVSGNKCWVAVGAPGRSFNRGGVYLYSFSSGNSTFIPQTKAPATLVSGDKFGSSVALTGNSSGSIPCTLAVGAPGRNTNAGAAWLYRQDLGGTDAWGELKNIVRPASPGGTGFGTRAALVKSTMLAVSQPPVGGAPGIVHVFERDQSGADQWGLLNTLTAPAGSPNRFAEALSASSIGILVGAPGGSAGKAYFYWVIDTAMTLNTTFAPGTATADFGSSVALSSDGALAIGDPSANSSDGKMYAWALTSFSPLTWSEHFQLNGGFGSALGTSVASSYFYFAGGAPNRSDVGTNYGAVDLYRAGDYETWAANQGVGFNNWYPDDDADGDGQKNLVEFALGSNPRSSGSMGALTMSRTTYVNGSTTWPAMRFDRPIHSYQTRAMHFRMQGGANLTTWGTARYSTLPDSTTARYYRSEAAKSFFRLAPKYPDFNAEDSGDIILVP